MRVTYVRSADPGIEVAAPPTPEIIDGVEVEWEVVADKISGLRFTVSGVQLEIGDNGALITDSPDVITKVYAAAGFVGDRIRMQTGFDVILPSSVVSGSPDEIIGETPEEIALLERSPKRSHRSIRVSAALSRAFDPSQATDYERLHTPLGHYVRGLRIEDPLLKYENFFKAIEYFAAKRPGDDPTGKAFDRQLSEVTTRDQDQIKVYRELRVRVVHPLTDKVHIEPHDIKGIREVLAQLDGLRELAQELLLNPPAFPR